MTGICRVTTLAVGGCRGPLEDAAFVHTAHYSFRHKSLLQHRKRLTRFGAAAHEHVERRVATLWPSMDADVAFGQHRHATYSAIGREGVQMNVKERRPSRVHGIPECLFDTILVVEAFRLPKIDDEVAARESNPFARDKMVPLNLRWDRFGLRWLNEIECPSSGDCRQTEFASSHADTSLPKVLTLKRVGVDAPTQEESGGRKSTSATRRFRSAHASRGEI